MGSLSWYLFAVVLSLTTWSNLFISLLPVGRIYVSHYLYLDSEESESNLLLEGFLLELQRFLESSPLILFIFLSSRRDPKLLVTLKSILFCFLIAFSSFFHILSDFLYYSTALTLLPIGPLSPSLMSFWLVKFPKQSWSLYILFFCLGVTDFFQITQWRWVPW